MHTGFAVPGLTTWLRRLALVLWRFQTIRAACAARVVERVMGFEPTTSTLARLHSTTELHPRERPRLAMAGHPVNGQFCGSRPVARPSGRSSTGGPQFLLRPLRD